jgi:FkbM family methyltransferase
MEMPRPILDRALRGLSRLSPTGRGMLQCVQLAKRLYPRKHWSGVFATPEGLALDLDLSTYPDCCMAFGLYELTTARLIKRLLRPGDHFVDGGANLGYFTLLAAKQVREAGRVDAFEPAPANHQRLRENLERNALSACVQLHRQALAEQAGQAALHVYNEAGRNHGEASLYEEAGVVLETVTVSTARMDQVLADTTPRLIKLDLEGAEAAALRGMEGLLQVANPPAIIMEFSQARAEATDHTPLEAVNQLQAIAPAYQVHRIGWRVTRVNDPPRDLASVRQCNLLLTATPGKHVPRAPLWG